MFWERLWPGLWPLLAVAGLFLLVALLDLLPQLPAVLHGLLLLGFALALAAAAWRGWQGFRAPDAAAAERRLEQASGLRHRPLATLSDRPAGDDPTALALWRAHQQRAAAAIRRLKVGTPHPGLPARDPQALRLGLLLAVLAGFGIAGVEAPERLRRAVQPHLAAARPAPVLRIEAWVTPPAYTGAAPIFLDAAGGRATVPAGSRLQLALSGGQGPAPELVSAAGRQEFRGLDGASFTAELVLEEGQRLAISRNGQEVVAWTLAVQADSPPVVAFTEPPARAPRGLAVRLPWRAEDDWGVVALRAEARLDARPNAPPLVLELPLPGGNARQLRGVNQQDLSAHPWAGLPVTLRLLARDGAGQEGQSDAVALELPERSFNHPVARRLIAVRRALSLDPDARTVARRELEAIGEEPQAFEHDTATYLALRSARSRLVFDRRAEAIAEVQETLWQTALALEEGRDGRTARALQQAREALRDAMEQAQRLPEDSAQRAEVERRIQELRDAIRQHLEAMAERLQRENAEALPFDPQQRLADQRDMERRTRRMEEAAREGRMQDAQRELAELEEMLRALEEGRSARAEPPERQQRRERGQQQMSAVQDMVRRESELLDRSHQRAEQDDRARAQQRRQNSFQRNAPQAQPPQSPQQRAEAEQDGRRQRALRRALGELMQQFGDLTGEVPESLGQADQAMREAQEALREGRSAAEPQQRAMRHLMEGGRQMAQQMQRQFGMSQEGEEDGEGEDQAGTDPGGQGQDQAQGQGEGRDPLGRRSRDVAGSAENGADTRVPDEAEQLRSRRIQEELRRRGAERGRPPEELDYIDRLLKRF